MAEKSIAPDLFDNPEFLANAEEASREAVEVENELGERSDCDACGLAFWVIANNDAEIMLEGLRIEFCPRCGERIDEEP